MGPRGAHPKGLGAPTPAIGNLQTPALDSPCSPPPPGPLGAPPVIQAGEGAGPSEPPRTFDGPRPKALGPTFPLLSALSSACPSARCTSSRSGLPDSWGLTRPLAGLLRGPIQGAWRPNAGDWEAPNPSTGLTLQPTATWAVGAPPVIQGGRTGRALRVPGELRRPRAPKHLGPRSISPAPSPPPHPPLATPPVDPACRRPEG